jgi:hypothetical protein
MLGNLYCKNYQKKVNEVLKIRERENEDDKWYKLVKDEQRQRAST